MARKKRPDFNQVEWARRASYPHSREECRDCVHYGMRPPVCNSLERHFLGLPEEADETQECPFREEETAESGQWTFYHHSREQCRECFFFSRNPPMCTNLSVGALYTREEFATLPECPFREAMLM